MEAAATGPGTSPRAGLCTWAAGAASEAHISQKSLFFFIATDVREDVLYTVTVQSDCLQ
jgi:hypothetical protein